MRRPSHLSSVLKKSDPELKNYVLELEKENSVLQKRIAKLEVKHVSQQHQIAALKKVIPEVSRPCASGEPV